MAKFGHDSIKWMRISLLRPDGEAVRAPWRVGWVRGGVKRRRATAHRGRVGGACPRGRGQPAAGSRGWAAFRRDPGNRAASPAGARRRARVRRGKSGAGCDRSGSWHRRCCRGRGPTWGGLRHGSRGPPRGLRAARPSARAGQGQAPGARGIDRTRAREGTQGGTGHGPRSRARAAMTGQKLFNPPERLSVKPAAWLDPRFAVPLLGVLSRRERRGRAALGSGFRGEALLAWEISTGGGDHPARVPREPRLPCLPDPSSRGRF